MSKEVMVSICGVQYAEDEATPVEVICRGERYEKNGKTYVLYEEVVEDQNGEPTGTVRNTIKFQEGQVDLIKRGPQGTHMVFDEGKTSVTYYTTPVGELTIGLDTSSVHIDMDEESIYSKIEYDLSINDSHISRCEVVIKVEV